LALKIVSGLLEKGDRVVIDFEEDKIKILTSKDLMKTSREKKREKTLVH